ncbi:uncharacterized protein EV422DRAFT_425947 [Fimicolochytrium jonesii]|uniref:uncharacterized protein n=1 Tax=Fimicolochytrium jonesii TaxID=1396493 RepID=UPI0022FE6AFB|nr:uncharacterized protein EV422DRAFT_425947 [Fimicolochytrium jonesii]KAI8821650.1 hypothetical protein EV422DRAFT_425947 [Fimicolochytrium jonesii]
MSPTAKNHVHQHELLLAEDDPYLANSMRPGELTQKRRGKYVEIPQVLDGFFMLNKAPAEDPDNVYYLDLTGENLRHVIEDDLTLFANLEILHCGENNLPLAKLGVLPGLRRLVMPCNDVTDLDLEVEGRFLGLEELDLSYNRLTPAGITVLASLPSLRRLDLSTNGLTSLPTTLMDMTNWRERVIESLLPEEDLQALEGWLKAELPAHGDGKEAKGGKEMNGKEKKVSKAEDAAAASSPSVIAETATKSNDVPATERPAETPADPGSEENVADGSTSDRPTTIPQVVQVAKEMAVTIDEDDDDASIATASDAGDAEAPDAADSEEVAHSEEDVEESAVDRNADVADEENTVGELDANRAQNILNSSGGPGFKRLELLSLENNRINSPETFRILAALPNLKTLNLSRNHITTLAFLTPARTQSSFHAGVPDTSEPRYDGFYSLVEVNLSFNNIGSPEQLTGVIWLPALKRVFLEGNPVMQRVNQKVTIRDGDSDTVLGYLHFNPLFELPQKYSIQIADAVYNIPTTTIPCLSPTSTLMRPIDSPREITPDHDTAPLVPRHLHPAPLTRPAQYHTTIASSRFLSHLHRKNAPPSISGRNIVASHTVSDAGETKWTLEAGVKRKARRAYDFSDEDFREIVRQGFIPDVEELVKIGEEREMRMALMEAMGQGGLDGGRDSDGKMGMELGGLERGEDRKSRGSSPGSEGARLEDAEPLDGEEPLQYDPTAKDDTFLTRVHITGGGGLGSSDDHMSSLSSSQASGLSTPPRTPSPFSTIDVNILDDDTDADLPPLPKTLTGALRALRHALSNPVSGWAPVPKPYALQTLASTQKAYQHQVVAGGRGKAAFGGKAPFRFTKGGGAGGKGGNTAVLPSLPPRGTPKGGRVTTKNAGPSDEFTPMRELMRGVDEKIEIVEESIAALMKPAPALRFAIRNASLIPPSQKLLHQVQTEYDRIERMYTVAALAERSAAARKPQNAGARASAAKNAGNTSPSGASVVV